MVKKENNIVSELKHIINWKTNSTFLFNNENNWNIEIYINFLNLENKNNLRAFIKNINKIKNIITLMYETIIKKTSNNLSKEKITILSGKLQAFKELFDSVLYYENYYLNNLYKNYSWSNINIWYFIEYIKEKMKNWIRI